MSDCPGAGQRWIPGMGRAVCPVCHTSSAALGLHRAHDARAVRRLLDAKALVPTHEHAASRAHKA